MSDKKAQSSSVPRPPVVVILGHVDHGKTSILDFIRKTKVADKEAGGITQHVGAYQVVHQNKTLTFIDTPGHEAFGTIRSRGANVADVAILVIAADEGIKPQTKESIKILKESETQFIVALNKIDKSGADAMKVRQQLAEQDVLVEDYGGQVPVVEVSAATGQGIDHLLELVLLVSDLEELTADPSASATGVVIESHVDKFKGTVATLLVNDGMLKVGDWIVGGSAFARVKALEDFQGKRIAAANASEPCVVMGWEALPVLGQVFSTVKDKKTAESKAKESQQSQSSLFKKETGPELVANLIIKADVQSSLEAIDQTLRTIKSEKADWNVVDFGVGNISDSDIKNARAKNAYIVGFHVSVDRAVAQMAERESISIQTSDIIYELVDAVRKIMIGLLPVEVERSPLGRLKVLATFGVQGKSQIVGGRVTKGKALRGALIDVLRKDISDGIGKLVQLQQNKEEAKEVAEGNECGIRFEASSKTPDVQIQVGDVFDIFEEKRIDPEL